MAMLIYHIGRHLQANSLRNLREQATLGVLVKPVRRDCALKLTGTLGHYGTPGRGP